MLSPQLRRKVHDLWSDFWSSGLSNPLVAIEQITYLLFIRQLEALDRDRVKAGKPSIYAATAAEIESAKKSKGAIPSFDTCKWSYISKNPSFKLLNEIVFPWLRILDQRVGDKTNGNTTLGRISGRLSDAYFILDVNKTEMLKRAVSAIDDLFKQLDTRSVNADIMGDIFEYLLEEVKESGKNGQFRTPRQTIRFMAQLLDPELGKTVLDPACGSGGFLLNCLLHWKAENTDAEVLRLEWDGTAHRLLPSWPKGVAFNPSRCFVGYDNDRTMVRIAWMNLILHGLETPEIHQRDSLSKRLDTDEHGKDKPQSGTYDYILANPPFTGSVDESDLSDLAGRFPRGNKGPITTKSELLFVWLMLDLLKVGGRTAVIVPDGVLFGGTNAHIALRRTLLFENTLEAVISLPANMFQPYSGVKTSILIFQKIGDKVAATADPRTNRVWFYEISDEAYSLDQKRQAQYGQDNDLWDALEKFKAWLAGDEAASIATTYFQPDYWEERWRSVDDATLQIFPDLAGDKGHTHPLHELWPQEFAFDPQDPRGARQYDEAVIDTVGPKVLAIYQREALAAAQAARRNGDADVAIRTAVDKHLKKITGQVNKALREQPILDTQDDQFGLAAFKSVQKQIDGLVAGWLGAPAPASDPTLPTEPPAPVKRGRGRPPKSAAPATPVSLATESITAEPNADQAALELQALLPAFAKLDGYNIWRRSTSVRQHPGKRQTAADGTIARVPTTMSWIVPVRVWAERENWGVDPTTQQAIAKPTHINGVVDPTYLTWLHETLEIFGDDGLVLAEHRDRLDPDCLEALDLNLSAGRHKPFVFDAGEHRDPAELIKEMQVLHGQMQERLEKLLRMVGGAD
ncbi:hypothetical protein LBMAG53_39620 [Planctomycetota bacterium]|nr:hypothetical protein LBMAG53_39620 [Planctomycetota bacterium]